MAYLIGIMGESGNGKSTSLRNLDQKTTFIIDSDRKGLPWRGWRKSYNKENKNYIQTSDADIIRKTLNIINKQEEFKHIKTVVIDTINAVMVDSEMERMKDKGYDKWAELATDVYGIMSDCLSLRLDLTIVCIFHTEDISDDNGIHHYRIKTSGRKLQKIQLETKLPVLLFAKCEGGKYYFETQSNFSTAKSPMGLFKELKIDNDINFVIQELEKYENESIEL
jgi:hypothetical protein